MYQRLILLLCMFAIIACQEDNFDEFTTEPIFLEPIELKRDDQIIFRIGESEKNLERGYGVVVDFFSSDTYFLSSDTITLCDTNFDPNGLDGTLNVIVQFSDFYVSYNTDQAGDVVNPTGAVVQVAENNEKVNYYGGFPFTPKCSTRFPTTLTIIEQTDDFVRGTFEAEFFQSIADSLIAPVPDNCDDWESVGIMQAAFNIPISICR